MSQLSWEDAQTFLAVAESGSFSAAARSLRVGQPTISRRIKSLEQKVEQQLFTRGKYGAQTTQAAEQLMPAAIQMAKWAVEFDRATKQEKPANEGVVKIACPPGIAVEQLAPFAASLVKKEPGIRLEILSAIDHIALTRGTADLAIRTQAPTEPELIALQAFESQPGVYGAKSYVNKLEQPCSWSELLWVSWGNRYRHVEPRPMLEKAIKDFTPVLESDDYLVQRAAVKAGLGVMICNAPLKGEVSPLVPVDIGVTLPKSKFYLVCAKSMQHVSIISTVVELLVTNMLTRITPTEP